MEPQQLDNDAKVALALLSQTNFFDIMKQRNIQQVLAVLNQELSVTELGEKRQEYRIMIGYISALETESIECAEQLKDSKTNGENYAEVLDGFDFDDSTSPV